MDALKGHDDAQEARRALNMAGDERWTRPTLLRCVGGPGDGEWHKLPPPGYVYTEERGGSYYVYAPYWPPFPLPPELGAPCH